MISEAFKAKVKDATDLLKLAEEYTEMRSVGYNVWQGKCPHPDHDDSTSSFTVYYNKDGTWSWCCYGCSAERKNTKKGSYGTDCFAFLMWLSNHKGSKRVLSWPQAVEALAKKAGIPMERGRNDDIYEVLKRRAKSYHKNLFPFVKRYLYNRGLDDADIEEWMLGFGTFQETNYSPDGKRRKMDIPRIVFPLIGRYGHVFGSSRRKLGHEDDKSIPKYWNSPTSDYFHKKEYLYGIQKYDPSFEEIRITEGQMDVILAAKYGVRNIVAPLGTAFSEEHAKFIQKERKTPCFCLDGDAAGLKATKKKVSMLADMGVYAKVLILPDGMDMADMANMYKDELEEYVQANAMPYWQFILSEEATRYEARLNELRAQSLPAIKSALEGVKSDEDNLLLKSYLKERFGLEYYGW